MNLLVLVVTAALFAAVLWLDDTGPSGPGAAPWHTWLGVPA